LILAGTKAAALLTYRLMNVGESLIHLQKRGTTTLP
jgi:hypothetical protein